MIGQTIRLVSDQARKRAANMAFQAPHGSVANYRPPTRSNEQNAKMWAMLSDVARAKPEGRNLTTDKWKALFMDAIGIPADWEPGINGGVVNVGYRSSRLTKEQMGDLIEQMYAYGAEHGVEWSEPHHRNTKEETR
jgi:hypothetical protein